jgi:hypothetical protein
MLFSCSGIFSQSDFTDIQTFIDSNITRNFLNTGFDNSNLSASFNSKLNYYHRFNKYNIYFKNYYSSSVTKLNEKLFRDFDNVKTGAGYNLNENINISLNYMGQFFSDDKTFQLKGTSSNYFYAGGLYDGTISGSQVYTFINSGYKIENQIGEDNRGPSVSGEFDIYNLNISEFIIDGQLKLGYESLDPRRKNLFFSRLYFEKGFQDNLARNEFDGTFSRIRKDFYFPADALSKSQFGINNNIEKRTEHLFKVFNRFDYTVSDKLAFYLTINPYYRNVDKENMYIPVSTSANPAIYDTQIQELSFSGDASLLFSAGSFGTQVIASYKERDEKHFLINPSRISQSFVRQIEIDEATKNNHTSIFKLSSIIYHNLNEMNRFDLSGSASILKYDTQSEENFDDRDELGFIIYLAHRFNNLKNLFLTTSVDLSLYHTVYVFAEKSSNNNWNRVLRFTGKSYFTPENWIRNIGTFSVLANYTVYDFEDIVSSVQSYSFRQLNLKDSLIVNFSRYFGIDVYGEVKLYERGELNWRAFSQRPINYYEDKIINSEFNYFFNKFIILSAGYKFFEQRRFNYVNGERQFDTFVRTMGPFARFRFEWNNNSRIELVGSYEYYSYGDGSPGSQNNNIFLNASWNF